MLENLTLSDQPEFFQTTMKMVAEIELRNGGPVDHQLGTHDTPIAPRAKLRRIVAVALTFFVSADVHSFERCANAVLTFNLNIGHGLTTFLLIK